MDRDHDPTPADRCARCDELFGDAPPPIVWWIGASRAFGLHIECGGQAARELYIAAQGAAERARVE